MTTGAITSRFPAPYLQPNPKEDCGYYAAAYTARCLGHPDVTAEQVKAWRAETRKHETVYARDALGAKMRTFWDYRRLSDEEMPYSQKIFWLGQDYKVRYWVRLWLAAGWIAQVMLHRIQPMGHAAVLLDADEERGVVLMDPIYGHITEPWEWFLGPGPKEGREDWPGTAPDGRVFGGCHFIEGWYRLPVTT